MVTSFTLVWIKIAAPEAPEPSCTSRASRSCGLKWGISHELARMERHELHARVD